MADAEVFVKPSLPSSAGPSKEPAKDEAEQTPAAAPPQKLKHLPAYTPPDWACPFTNAVYSVELIKRGNIMGKKKLVRGASDSFVIAGRDTSCDIFIKDELVSRRHCVLQYGTGPNKDTKAWYVYDLDSTSGVLLNRHTKLVPRQYKRINLGDIVMFRKDLFMVFDGPEEERDPDWGISPTEAMQKMAREQIQKRKELMAKRQGESVKQSDDDDDEKLDDDSGPSLDEDGNPILKKKSKKQKQKDEGIDWGMKFDEDVDLSELYSEDDDFVAKDEFYTKDPKKALQNYLEREGFELAVTFTESGANTYKHKWICTIKLPIAGGVERDVSATVTTSKKEAQIECSLEACKLLDRLGILRNSGGQRKAFQEENSSDEDEYFDRTGDVARKQELRAERAKLGVDLQKPKTNTFESLSAELADFQKRTRELEKQYNDLSKKTVIVDEDGTTIETEAKDDQDTKTKKSAIKQQLSMIERNEKRLKLLLQLAAPAAGTEAADKAAKSSNSQSLLLKMMKMQKNKPKVVEAKSETPTHQKIFVPEQDDQNPTTSKPSAREPAKPKRTLEDAKRELREAEKEAEKMLAEPRKRRRYQKLHSEQPPKPKVFKEPTEFEAPVDDDRFVNWLPPTDQAGDGTTKLNEKFAGRY